MSFRVLIVLFVLSALAAAGSYLDFFARSSYCGGNSAALGQASLYASTCRGFAMESSNHLFRVTEASSEQQNELASLSHNHWIPQARFLVSALPLADGEPEPQKRLIFICDTAYNNVPVRFLRSAPMTHAAAYSDGTKAMITSKQFAALDKSSFRYLDELFPAAKYLPRTNAWARGVESND